MDTAILSSHFHSTKLLTMPQRQRQKTKNSWYLFLWNYLIQNNGLLWCKFPRLTVLFSLWKSSTNQPDLFQSHIRQIHNSQLCQVSEEMWLWHLRIAGRQKMQQQKAKISTFKVWCILFVNRIARCLFFPPTIKIFCLRTHSINTRQKKRTYVKLNI